MSYRAKTQKHTHIHAHMHTHTHRLWLVLYSCILQKRNYYNNPWSEDAITCAAMDKIDPLKPKTSGDSFFLTSAIRPF